MNIHLNDTITRAILYCNNSLKSTIVDSTTKSILYNSKEKPLTEPYDGYGAARYIVVVVLVYGLGIVFFIGSQVRSSQKVSEEVESAQKVLRSMENVIFTKEVLDKLSNKDIREKDKTTDASSEAITRIENRIESMKNKESVKIPKNKIKNLILKQYTNLFDRQLSKTNQLKSSISLPVELKLEDINENLKNENAKTNSIVFTLNDSISIDDDFHEKITCV